MLNIKKFSIANFKRTLWSANIQTELDTITSLKDHCDYEFEGEVKAGEKLKILGAVNPTIGTYTPGSDITFEDADDTAMFLEINYYPYFAIQIDDVDKAQTNAKLMSTYTRQGAIGLSNAADVFVATTIHNELSNLSQKKIDISAATDGGISVLESAFQTLYENNVLPSEPMWFETTAEWYVKLRPEIIELSTNNPELIKKGIVGMYGNAYVTIENNLKTGATVASQAGCTEALLRTSKAVAFAGTLSETEAIKPEKRFSEVVKALYVCGAKVVRPEQIVVIGVY